MPLDPSDITPAPVLRTGGEEFLLRLPDVRLNDAVRIVEQIQDGFPPAVLGSCLPQLPYTFSAGITEALRHDDRSSILFRADRALYAAKTAGRNCTKIGFEAEALSRANSARHR